MDTSLSVAFIVGLFSTPHCVGMCGGIMGALSYGLKAEDRQQPARLFVFVMAYNLGRILSYAAAGALIGGAGGMLAEMGGDGVGHRWLQWLASVILILIGLHVAGWLPRLTMIERIGLPLWRHLEPVGRRLMPVQSPLMAVVYGAVWGWLPCGLVYTMLITTTAQADSLSGALYMAVFGLGTLPAVAATGLLAGRLYALMRTPYLKVVIGVIIIGLGMATLLFPTYSGTAVTVN
ncbi:sulfite exporter TauE/SafE family protein [Pseudomonadota bacterium]